MAVFTLVLVVRRHDLRQDAAAGLANSPEAVQAWSAASPQRRGAQGSSAATYAPDDASSQMQTELPLAEVPQPDPPDPVAVPLDELTGEPIVAELVRY